MNEFNDLYNEIIELIEKYNMDFDELIDKINEIRQINNGY